MKDIFVLALGAAVLLSGLGTLGAQSQEETRVDLATEIIQKMSKDPDQAIPESLVERSRGIAVIPKVVKVGLIVGGQHGKGIMVVRRHDGSWSNPYFLSLSSGSVGLQIGGQGADVVLLFMTERAAEEAGKGKFTLGADAGAAAGPVGRQAGKSTDTGLEAEIYTYAWTRGLFAGFSVEGAVLRIDEKANANYYGKSGISVDDIVRDRYGKSPSSASKFRNALTNY
jgi:lipid-binding SYLF domain-containing protein